MANFNRFTRYTNGIITKDRAGRDFLVLRPPLNLEPSSDDIFVTISQQFLERPDRIAQVAYGDRRLWWVIFEFNNIRDPLFDLRLGQILRIPSRDRVVAAIGNINEV